VKIDILEGAKIGFIGMFEKQKWINNVTGA